MKDLKYFWRYFGVEVARIKHNAQKVKEIVDSKEEPPDEKTAARLSYEYWISVLKEYETVSSIIEEWECAKRG